MDQRKLSGNLATVCLWLCICKISAAGQRWDTALWRLIYSNQRHSLYVARSLRLSLHGGLTRTSSKCNCTSRWSFRVMFWECLNLCTHNIYGAFSAAYLQSSVFTWSGIIFLVNLKYCLLICHFHQWIKGTVGFLSVATPNLAIQI